MRRLVPECDKPNCRLKTPEGFSVLMQQIIGVAVIRRPRTMRAFERDCKPSIVLAGHMRCCRRVFPLCYRWPASLTLKPGMVCSFTARLANRHSPACRHNPPQRHKSSRDLATAHVLRIKIKGKCLAMDISVLKTYV